MRAILVVVLLAAACGGDRNAARAIPGDRARAITVEVLNANGRAGDARVATRLLRHDGIDVVYFGNAGAETLDSTRILVRRGSQEVGEKVRKALGRGHVEVQLDSTKLLDVSVLLGADFTSLEFHP